MSGPIVETLYGQFAAGFGGGAPGVTARNSFTVNNAVTEVTIDVVSALWYFCFRQKAGKFNFDALDNVLVLAAGVTFPYHFIPGDAVHNLSYIWVNAANVAAAGPPQLAPTTYTLSFPIVGAEIDLGLFLPAPGTTKWSLGCYYANLAPVGNVSMIGVPATLNGQVLYPIPFVKVLHTLPMVA